MLSEGQRVRGSARGPPRSPPPRRAPPGGLQPGTATPAVQAPPRPSSSQPKPAAERAAGAPPWGPWGPGGGGAPLVRRPGARGAVAPHSLPRGARTPQLLGLSGGGARGNRGYTYWEFGMHRTETVTRMVASLGIDRGMGASFPVRAGPAQNGTGAGVYCQRPYCASPPAHAQTQVSLPTSFLSSGCPERPDGTRRPGLRPYFSLTSSAH